MPKPSTIARAIRRIENWPEVFSMKLGMGSRELSLLSFRDGLELACRRSSRDWDIIRALLVTGAYTRSLAYIRELPSTATVLDLGGNIGCFSLLVAMRNPLLQIVSYEPGPQNVRMFRLNLLANPLLAQRIELIEEAVGGTTRMAAWHFDSENAGGSALMYENGNNGQSVRVRSLAEVVAGASEPIAFAKIDIEGAEHEVFDDTPPAVWSRIPAFTIEVHDDPRGRTSTEVLLAHIRTLGYRVERDDQFAWFCSR